MVKSGKPETLFKRALRGYGWLFFSQVMSFFINMSFAALPNRFLILKIFACFCTFCITLGIVFNWSYNCIKTDEILNRQKTKLFDRLMPLKMAACIGLIPAALYIALLLSKAGLIDNFLPVFSLTMTWELPFRSLLSTATDVKDIPAIGMVGFGFLTLLIPATAALTYIFIKRGFTLDDVMYE
jgi:hypothetical protein